MKLAASNIAWRIDDRLKAYALLERHGFTGLEIAPALFFHSAADPYIPDQEQADAALAEVDGAGLRIISMQSLLFGVNGAALFGSSDEQLRFDVAMRRAISLAGRFGIPNLVFGSPRQRNVPEAMSPEQADEIAIAAFQALGDAAQAARTAIAIEPNPAAYGANFLTRTEEALSFVAKVNHPAIGLNLDVGALLMNDEISKLESLVAAAAGRIAHVHISQPQLEPAPERIEAAAQVIRTVSDAGYAKWFSIEMKAVEESSLATLDRSLERLAAAAAEAGLT